MWASKIILAKSSNRPLTSTTNVKRVRINLHFLAIKSVIDVNHQLFHFICIFCQFCHAILLNTDKDTLLLTLLIYNTFGIFQENSKCIFFYSLSSQYLKTSFKHRLIFKNDDIQFLSCSRQYLVQHLLLRVILIICY